MKAIRSDRIPLGFLLGEESPCVGLTREAVRVGHGSTYLKDAPDVVAAMAFNAIGSSAAASEHAHINVGVQ